MDIVIFRELIQQAHLSEARHGHLADLIASHLPRLHRIIQSQGENTGDILIRFVHACVEQAPGLLDATNSMVREAGVEEQIKPVLRVAEQFFLTPPALLTGHGGLDILFDEAYPAHHLMEGVDDHYITYFSQTLIPLDTTVANPVAHQLIGEPFANRLDEAVHHAAENMFDATAFDADSARAYRKNLKNPRVVAAQQQWPCLSKQLGVELSLD